MALIKNKATVNEDVDPSVVISKLKNENLNLRDEIGFLKGEAGEGDALTPKVTPCSAILRTQTTQVHQLNFSTFLFLVGP